MTTEKCHSVCLLVHDNIFSSPKDRPWPLCRLHPSHSISVFSNSLNNPKFGGSQKSKILIGIPSLDIPMTNLPPKNGWNSLEYGHVIHHWKGHE